MENTSSKIFWGRLLFDLGFIASIGDEPAINPMGDYWETLFRLYSSGMLPLSKIANEQPIKFHADNFYISEQVYHKLRLSNRIIDATKGGLVLGQSHIDGGIQFIIKNANGYFIAGEMEGYEYLINYEAVARYQNEIVNINNSIKPSESLIAFDWYKIPAHIKTIEVLPHQILELSENVQFIVNKLATQKHLNDVQLINDYELMDELRRKIIHPILPEKKIKKWYLFWKL